MKTTLPPTIARLAGCALALALSLVPSGLRADQLPNPTVTASARPFSAGFVAANLFDTANAEYASLSQGAVSAPFTTAVTDGTWVEMDFGATVQFDRFVLRTRANAVDVIGQSRLIVSQDPIFDATDRIFTFDPTGANGAGLVRYLNELVAGRYARWEVLTRTGAGLNLGGNQMWFLQTPAGHSLLPPPAVIDSSTPFSAGFLAAQAVDGDFGPEYASAGAQGAMFIDFDFDVAKPITGFEFLNRFSDRVTTFDLIFADAPDFSVPLATLSFTADPSGNFVNSATFDPVTARYVRLQATGFEGAVNTGVREIQFLTLAGQPPTITRNPTGGSRLAGDTFALSSAAVGDIPLSFQWLREGVVVPGATSSTLLFTSLQASDSGNYEVVVTNPNGSVTSAPPVLLTVLDPPLDITSDLLLWLKLDETTGDVAVDASGQGRDGTLAGFPGDDSQWVAGRIDGAIRLNPDGSAGDDVVLVPEDGGLDFSSSLAFTLSAWVNGGAIQEDGGALFAKGTGAGGEQYAVDVVGGAYRFFVRNASGGAAVFQTAARPNDTWQHVVAVFSTTLNRAKFYVNGAEVLSGTPTGDLLQNSHEVSIGSRQLGAADYNLNFNGRIDDVRIYGRALTPRDVTALHAQASLIPPTIVSSPASGSFFAFENVTLTVAADGSAPLRYEWSKNNVVIPGATNDTLRLNNITSSDAGDYVVTVSNARGEATSPVATITVSDPAADLLSGLLLHLKLDETSGTLASDASGLSHDGVLQGFDEPLWTAGIIGGGLAFNPDGAAGDDVVLVTDDGTLDFAASMEFSLSAWVNGDPVQEAGGPVICKGTGAGGEQFAIDVFNGYRFYGWTGGAPPAPALYILSAGIGPDRTWQHLVGVFSLSLDRVKFYVNGVEVASVAAPATIVEHNHDVSIGSRQLGAGPYDLNFNGTIDDVRIYNRVLTPREIRTLSEFGNFPQLAVSRSAGQVTVSWPTTVVSYTLQSSGVLPATTWTPVTGVVNNSVTLTPGPGQLFFRLIKQ